MRIVALVAILDRNPCRTRRAAKILGLNRNTLRKKLTEHGMDPDHVA
jgi:DNA-binding protein Fis